MDFTVKDPNGPDIEFECADNWVSRWVCEAILEGKTYPHLGFVDDIRTVWDVGANCGATTVHLARHHRDATIHAFEPGATQRAYLERNTAAYDNVQVHPIGLHREDQSVPLYGGTDDTITASIFQRSVNVEASEQVELRDALGWAREHGIDRIDLMKLDVEGCEVEVLESLAPLLGDLKVLYVEYDSRYARRRIDDLLRDTHELFFGMFMSLDQGDGIYVNKSLVDHPDAMDTLREIVKVEGGDA